MYGTSYVYKGGDGRWYWRHMANNGREDGASEQGYLSKWWAKHKARKAFPYAMLVSDH